MGRLGGCVDQVTSIGSIFRFRSPEILMVELKIKIYNKDKKKMELPVPYLPQIPVPYPPLIPAQYHA